MAIGYIIYAAMLTYATTVAASLLGYGGIDYRSGSNRTDGVLELLAGGLLLLYLTIVHFEGFTQTIVREISHGALVSRAYLLLPIVLGFVSTDYVVRRVLPLVSRVVGTDETNSADLAAPTTRSRLRSRRSVLGFGLGVLTASLGGGVTVLRDALGSPEPESAAFQRQTSFEAPYLPTALTFDERGHGFVTNIEGRIFKFERPTPDQESLQFEEVAAGIGYPQGVEVSGDTLYTVDNGEAAGGKYGIDEGYEVLQESSGAVIAFDVGPDGSLTNKRTIVSNLPVVNSDHALHQIVTGPDDRLYLSIGHLGAQKFPELFEDGEYTPTSEAHPNVEYLGTVISFDRDGSAIEIEASGLRNVYDLAFDRRGNLFGANNDGMSVRSKVWESLCLLTDDANFGYPEYGTFDEGPADVEIRDPLWVLDGIQSTGVETTDSMDYRDGVVVGLIGKVVFVPLDRGEDGVYVPDFLRPEPTVIELSDDPIIVEAGPDGLLWVGSTGADDTLSVYRPDS